MRSLHALFLDVSQQDKYTPWFSPEAGLRDGTASRCSTVEMCWRSWSYSQPHSTPLLAQAMSLDGLAYTTRRLLPHSCLSPAPAACSASHVRNQAIVVYSAATHHSDRGLGYSAKSCRKGLQWSGQERFQIQVPAIESGCTERSWSGHRLSFCVPSFLLNLN